MVNRTLSIRLLSICIITILKTTNGLIHNLPFRYRHKETSTALSVESTTLATVAVVAFVGGGAIWLGGSDERAQKAKYAELDAKNKAIIAERERLAYIEPKEYWTEEELGRYDGTDDDGPILFAADGTVFNVWRGRNFYGPGCEYHIFAGRDATRLLAKQKLEEETEEEMKKELSIAEKAALQGWMYTFKSKYEVVGKLERFDPKTTSF